MEADKCVLSRDEHSLSIIEQSHRRFTLLYVKPTTPPTARPRLLSEMLRDTCRSQPRILQDQHDVYDRLRRNSQEDQ